MSTRCQVKVMGTDVNGSHAFTLYHHCDGYPSYMLPIIGKAYTDKWQAERPGKAAAMLCAADPTGYEVEQGHSLHGDIEYYYVVDVTGGNWKITAYDAPFDADSIADMTKIDVYSVNEALEYSE